jgi:anti-sigma factor RsiW
MNHPESSVLSELLDGALAPEGREEVEAHLEACGECSALLRDLFEVRRRAASLPVRHPSRDLWPGIQAAIGERGGDSEVIRLYPELSGEGKRRRRRGFRLSYFQAAAAGLVLALFSGALGAFLTGGVGAEGDSGAFGPPPWVEAVSLASPALETTAQEVVRLEDVLAEHRDQLDPETILILEKNLQVIDHAIQESLEALSADPGNAFLETHLARSVEAKVAYLREAMAFVVPVS